MIVRLEDALTLCYNTNTQYENHAIRFFHQSHNTVWGGVFAFKKWISSSLKRDTVPRVNNLYSFYVNTHQDVLHYGMVKIVNTRYFLPYEQVKSLMVLNAVRVSWFPVVEIIILLSQKHFWSCFSNRDITCMLRLLYQKY